MSGCLAGREAVLRSFADLTGHMTSLPAGSDGDGLPGCLHLGGTENSWARFLCINDPSIRSDSGWPGANREVNLSGRFMARRSRDTGEDFLRLIFALAGIFILAAGGGAAFKNVLAVLLILFLGSLGVFFVWLAFRLHKAPPKTRGEELAEYLRSRPYDRVSPGSSVPRAAPPSPPPQPAPGGQIREEVSPKHQVRAPDVDEIVAHLRALDWFQFESAMGVLFGHVGHRVRRTGGANPDGGIDLELTRGAERIAVQCKHWQAGEVGVKVVREFMGAMVAAGITQGILIGSAGFTGPARELAAQQRIELLDERDVARRIQSAGGWWDPLFRSAFVSPPKLCPKCGSPLVERVAKRGPGIGRAFYGCSRYPRCTQTMPG